MLTNSVWYLRKASWSSFLCELHLHSPTHHYHHHQLCMVGGSAGATQAMNRVWREKKKYLWIYLFLNYYFCINVVIAHIVTRPSLTSVLCFCSNSAVWLVPVLVTFHQSSIVHVPFFHVFLFVFVFMSFSSSSLLNIRCLFFKEKHFILI